MNLDISAGNDVVVKDGRKEMNDALLVLAARSGDAAAFIELTKRHSHKLLRKTYQITKNWHDAEDALQDSFLRAFIHLNDFEERCSFSSWLTRIAINSSLMILRKKRRYLEISIDDTNDQSENREKWELRDLSESPESRCAKRENQERLKRAIRRLPPRFRDVVQLQHAREYSVQQIAQALGISVPAAKSRIARARMALRTSLL